MNKTLFIILFLLFSTPLFSQIEPTHSMELRLDLLISEGESRTGDKYHSILIFLEIGYTYVFENGFIIGTSVPVIGYHLKSNSITSFPWPGLILGYGDKINSLAFFTELRYLALVFSVEAGFYYKNTLMSAGFFWLGAPGLGSISVYGVSGGYSININKGR